MMVKTGAVAPPLRHHLPVDIGRLRVGYLRITIPISLKEHILPIPDELRGARSSYLLSSQSVRIVGEGRHCSARERHGRQAVVVVPGVSGAGAVGIGHRQVAVVIVGVGRQVAARISNDRQPIAGIISISRRAAAVHFGQPVAHVIVSKGGVIGAATAALQTQGRLGSDLCQAARGYQEDQ